METQKTKYEILETALGNIPFDGWEWTVFEDAAIKSDHEKAMASAIFPRKIHDTLSCFSEWADDQMLEVLNNVDTCQMRVRDRIIMGVQTRIQCLTPYKDCVRESAKQLSKPQHVRLGAQITWDCADKIWEWAGDTSTDYNRYTKRGLLSGVIGSTMLYWLQDDSENHHQTIEFLHRRIDNVLFLGKNISPVIKPVASLVERFIVPLKQEKPS
jgi:ubiquinone biosynthesis protein COQ9